MSRKKPKGCEQNWHSWKILESDTSAVMLAQTLIVSIISTVDGCIKANLIIMEIKLIANHTNLKWTNPNAEARNRRVTITFVSSTIRLQLAFG